jgi:hypothetical protein
MAAPGALAIAPAALFSPASQLLSRAYWFARDHPQWVLGFGLFGTAPAAAVFLLLLHESFEALLVPGTTLAGLRPVCYGLAGLAFMRFPLRLALARLMAEVTAERGASAAGAALFGLVQAPTAFLYGSLSTLGYLVGSLLILPLGLAFQAELAFHRFAATTLTPWEAFREAGRLPVTSLGLKLFSSAGTLWIVAFLVLWTAPGATLDLLEWLLRTDVAALRELFGTSSPAWLAAALVLTLSGAEMLFFIALGLFSAEWQRLAGGSDLQALLDGLEEQGRKGLEVFE